MSRVAYLNNSGSKWVVLPRTEMKFRLIDENNNYNKIRIADYYESFGNFGAIVFRYKGKRLSRLVSEQDQNNLPTIIL